VGKAPRPVHGSGTRWSFDHPLLGTARSQRNGSYRPGKCALRSTTRVDLHVSWSVPPNGRAATPIPGFGTSWWSRPSVQSRWTVLLPVATHQKIGHSAMPGTHKSRVEIRFLTPWRVAPGNRASSNWQPVPLPACGESLCPPRRSRSLQTKVILP